MVTTALWAPPANRESGQILILAAVTMIALLGIAALSLNASFMYDKRNRLHAAADAAAKSAAIEVHRYPDPTMAPNLQPFADQQVAEHGFTPTSAGGTAIVVVHHDPGPATGPFAGNANYVEVIVSEPTSTFFGRVLGFMSMTPAARAVAGPSPGANCIVTLGPGGPASLTLGVANLDMPTCGIAVTGNLATANSTSITAQFTGVTGACTGGGCPANWQVAPAPADPLASLPAPTDPTPGVLGPDIVVPNHGTVSLTTTGPSRGKFNNITLGQNAELYLGPGTYYITGAISTGNSPRICLNATCTFDYTAGVMIYLAGPAGSINLPNGTLMRLNAQTAGMYNGILFYQDRSNANSATFANGTATYDLSGAMYFPSAAVSFQNGGSTNDCALFVAKTLSLGNGQNTYTNLCSSYGGSPILTVSIAE